MKGANSYRTLRDGPASPSFETFYGPAYRDVLRLAYAITGSREAAEDVAQETMLAAMRNWPRVCGLDSPDLWTRRVAINQSRSVWRRISREARIRGRIANERRTPHREPWLDGESETVLEAFRAMPKRQQLCMINVYLLDQSVSQTASLVGISESTVRVHLHRGRAQIQQNFLRLADHERKGVADDSR